MTPVAPLRLSFEVDCAVEHAFATWTDRIAIWWPISHTMSGEPQLTVVFEGRVGGRIFERTSAGQELEWGQVTVWEPPRRLGYVWHLRATREDATDVEISFAPLGGSRTAVTIEHRGWERLGDRGPSWRDRNQAGWSGLLPHFVDACKPADRRTTND